MPRARARNAVDRKAPPAAHDDPPVRVLRQFRQVFNAVKAHFQRVEKKVGLGGAQVWALSLIRETPDIGVGELARAMDIHQSTASNLVKGLVERELVSVTKHEGDRRVVRLRLLPAGSRLLRRSPSPFTGVLPAALASLDERTLKRLEADLTKVIRELHADERASRVPLADL